MGAAHTYDHPEDAARDPSQDPTKSTWDRAQSRLDILDMQLFRWRFNADRLMDIIASIHLYSDASPVTGEELQGMVCEIVRTNGSTERTTLPGASLVYGGFNVVAKCIALVWAVWLVVGPTLDSLEYFSTKHAASPRTAEPRLV